MAGIALMVERLYDASVFALGDDVIEAYYGQQYLCLHATISIIKDVPSQMKPSLTLGGKLIGGAGEYKS